LESRLQAVPTPRRLTAELQTESPKTLSQEGN